MKITGKVIRLPFETKAYGILTDDGRQFLPVNMPEQLKREGAMVKCVVEPSDVMSVMMWGETVEIVSFETLF